MVVNFDTGNSDNVIGGRWTTDIQQINPAHGSENELLHILLHIWITKAVSISTRKNQGALALFVQRDE